MSTPKHPGVLSKKKKGRLGANRWLLLRRSCQALTLALFACGPLTGFWIIKGNLAASRLFDTVPLADPFILLQSLATGTIAASTAIIGALIIAGFYMLVGGRAYCSWVCPVNILTDGAAWLRLRLDIREGLQLDRTLRYWGMVLVLVVTAITGILAWELINPVTLLHRGLFFGLGLAWTIPVAIFCFDLFMSKRGWCGHLCPVGGFYSLLGLVSLIRVRAEGRDRCSNCLDCYAVCPEPQVISPALKGKDGRGPVITEANCTNCGRCIDVCAEGVFSFGSRF
ncbi:MAG: quinol dehydrogenase ferredoxin subunit NapH [Desulfobulbaceae bacterium]|nr:quinol dehydrogenase ferredoxin subunit NapH [Desulfobulbaceae bacterium]HIJ89522.1 quinol dehydrogenase ferredoxin subunit NapH [Deltaproteobacteria bacterium]